MLNKIYDYFCNFDYLTLIIYLACCSVIFGFFALAIKGTAQRTPARHARKALKRRPRFLLLTNDQGVRCWVNIEHFKAIKSESSHTVLVPLNDDDPPFYCRETPGAILSMLDFS